MKAVFVILRAIMLIVIGAVLWMIYGVSVAVDKSESYVNTFVSKITRKISRVLTNTSINLGTFSEMFYNGALQHLAGQYDALKDALRFKKELAEEYRGSESQEVVNWLSTSDLTTRAV